MADLLKPRDVKDVEDTIKWAAGESKALEIVGRGSKRAIGRPAQTDFTLDLSALTGVTLYEPEELVLSARAGTPLQEIEALVASKNQMLAFDPMNCSAILGTVAQAATIGGTLATNFSGPRRIKAGAARDHFLGFSAVSGRGETFKSGGRVVKNVTGYDLCKLMAGSWGTLAAMTEITIKVLPRPETEQTLAISGVEEVSAAKAMSIAMGSPCDVSAAAYVAEARVARVLGLSAASKGRGIVVLRLEGFAPSIAHRRGVLETLLAPYGSLAMVEGDRSQSLWRRIRDVAPFAADGPVGDWALWRVSTAPARGGELGALIGQAHECEILYDWAGGLIWLALPPSDDAGARAVRAAVAQIGGYAMLIRAPDSIRAAIEVFEPQSEPLARLSKRVKESFDPLGVLNPGRMYAGI